MNFVYDMDGTLIDTKEAVFRAYESANFNMTEELWNKPWQEIGISKEQHDEKCKIYPHFLKKYSKPLALYYLYQKIPGYILTGASLDACREIVKLYNIPHYMIKCNLTKEEKIQILQGLGYENCYYYDDDVSIENDIITRTRYTFINANEVNYG